MPNQPKKVILAEDADGMAKILADMLKKMGFGDVVRARHGGEAWEFLQKGSVGLLMTAWDMPVLDGLELVKKVRHEPKLADIPILMSTARKTKQDVVIAMRAGVDAYIIKPYTPGQLRQKISGILGQRPLRQAARVIRGASSLKRTDEFPLVVVAEMSSMRELAVPSNRHVLKFLESVSTGLHLVSQRADDTRLGYMIVGNSGLASRIMRGLRHRIKLLLVSSDLAGGGITLARLASIGRPDDLAIFLVCENLADIPLGVRTKLERLDILPVERHRLDLEGMEDMLDQHVLAKLRDDSEPRVLSPEEIKARIENDIRTMVNLPVLPEVYHRIVKLDRDPQSEIQEWVEAIGTDPLTQAQVIRRARSPVYGFQGQIDDIGKAVVLLGKNTVKELVVSSAVRRSCEGVEDEDFKVEEYWLHSASVGVMARLISFPLDRSKWRPEQQRHYDEFELEDEAHKVLEELNLHERFRLDDNQDPFTGGMMHDIGKVALAYAYPGLLKIITETMEAQGWNRPMRFAEELATGGIDHCRVGLMLAESWKLGDSISSVVERHHTPAADDPFAKLICLADFLASGLYRYPGQATYPTTRLLGEEEAGGEEGEAEATEVKPESPPTAEAKEDSSESGEDGGGDQVEPADDAEALAAIAQESTDEALAHFLPQEILDELELTLPQLLDMARMLTPIVRRLTERLRQGSG